MAHAGLGARSKDGVRVLGSVLDGSLDASLDATESGGALRYDFPVTTSALGRYTALTGGSSRMARAKHARWFCSDRPG
jgi:hypothetical protein